MKEGLHVEVKKLHTAPFPYDKDLTLNCVWEARVVCYSKGKRLWSEHATAGSKQIFRKDAVNEGQRLLREKFTEFTGKVN